MARWFRLLSALLPAALLLAWAPAAFAVDGVVLINQATILNGLPGCGTTHSFPVRICHSGSYRLAGNLDVPAGTDGVEIDTNEVTLDLNGFSIGGPGPGAGATGINISGVYVTVRNGIIGGFQVGLHAGTIPGGVTARQLQVMLCNDGIDMVSGTVEDSILQDNQRFGVQVMNPNFTGSVSPEEGVLLTGNRITGNLVGVRNLTIAHLTNNFISDNSQLGIDNAFQITFGMDTIVRNGGGPGDDIHSDSPGAGSLVISMHDSACSAGPC
ncbi:MAG TPA: hypothetical protein VMV31_04790 [Terriglobales bacterium]|nr:hypothetical protein [Terriglobales bacterium]